MRAYLIRRFLLIIPTVFIVTVLVFLTSRFIPGDVIDMMVSEMASLAEAQSAAEIDVDWVRHQLGMDVPIHVQYWRWAGKILTHGDWPIYVWIDRDLKYELTGQRD